MPEMISIGCPSASRARSRKACLRREMRSALVPTTRTLRACMSRRRWPKRSRQASARAATCLSRRPSGPTPAPEPHHLAHAVDDDELAVRVAGDDEVKAVGTEIDGRQDVGHGAGRTTHEAAQAVVNEDPQPQVVVALGIADHELRAIEAVAKIDLGAAQVVDAHRIDQQLDALVLDAGVAVLQLFVELEAVLQARAAAALHEDAQHQRGLPSPRISSATLSAAASVKTSGGSFAGVSCDGCIHDGCQSRRAARGRQKATRIGPRRRSP